MEPGENHKRKHNKHAEVKLEQFKRAALEIIEYKDKIIRMLCAILEVQGTTTVPRTIQGTNNLKALNMSNDKMESLQKEQRKDDIIQSNIKIILFIFPLESSSNCTPTSTSSCTSMLTSNFVSMSILLACTHTSIFKYVSTVIVNLEPISPIPPPKLITPPEFRALKRNHELNLFSPPGKLNDELNKEKMFSDSILSSYKHSQNEVSDQLAENVLPTMHHHFLRFPMRYSASVQGTDLPLIHKLYLPFCFLFSYFTTRGILLVKIIAREISKRKAFVDEQQEGSSNESVQLNTAGSEKKFGESRNKELENFENPESNFESTYKPSTPGGMKNDKTSPQEVNQIAGDCQLCLMPNTESLHGNFPPVLYKLSCDHIFHLMCVYETVIRRECRKTCCICHKELSEEDKSYIISKVKREKKENEKKSKLLFKVMKLQAENKD
ncbi:conserved Plasmodium protein, unknown function [Plasmodium ovale wallikeri]|uniref:RING-type domain-containing protein n=1 Tax=Plasmodium ovale wallikeri TaxID=864142 RepID=A0A1A8Z857_PLAOA|nr:conserved Plasmodium protein, unknown function [Plasmodium ovale wallikeri]SBT40581.1 conserved Plasmodium protein, unknown function [Plasmodium ovale wallikeri]